MSLNIKNEKTVHLARELASVTGRRGKGLVARLLAIAADSGPRFKEPYGTIDHADLLYDEAGLPK